MKDAETHRVGVQGGPGSACDAARRYFSTSVLSPVYLQSAMPCLEALFNRRVEYLLLALESPVGTPVSETQTAIEHFGSIKILETFDGEVRHNLLARPNLTLSEVRVVVSHEVPLRKHRDFLRSVLGNYEELAVEDTGVAAERLLKGEFPPNAAVLALPIAAELFNLKVLCAELPANDHYLTRFGLVGRP